MAGDCSVDLAKARQFASVLANFGKRPAFIYRRADGGIVIAMVQRDRSRKDDVPLTLLETVEAEI